MMEREVLGFILIALALFGFYLCAFYSSKTVKVVTVKEKWVKYYNGGAKYLFSDTEGNVYSIEDCLWLWKWDASDRYAKIEPGHTYRITFYGWRIHILSWYPNAVEIVPIAGNPGIGGPIAR